MKKPIWQIAALKYGNQPHYTWPAMLRDDDGEQLRLSTVVGGVLVHYTRGFQELQRRPSDLTFWRNRWYNVFTNYDEDGTLRNFYCNVAMPPSITETLDENTLNFIDLDLDVRVFPDGSHVLLDEDEFVLHSAKFAYPEWVQNRARQAIDEIISLVNRREGPFIILKGQTL